MEENLIQKTLEISPLNASAFGALVLVLAIAVVFLWRAYDAKTQKLMEVLERSVGITAKVENHMAKQNDDFATLKEIKFELTRLSDLIKSTQYKK
jgi:type II secretory pathway component PulM